MAAESPSERDRLRRGFLTGVAVIVPSVITLAVLGVAFNAVYNYLDAFSSAIGPMVPPSALPISRELAVELVTPVVFVGSILLLGLAVESTRYGERAVDYADYAIEQIPGVGSVYRGFRQMSDVMLESDDENFREVVLVEFPTEEVYTLAFVTSRTPTGVAAVAESGEMRTVFMPMAPNPVMGGHVLFVPERRIVEVDLTVEEGVRALMTSGVALECAAADADGVSPSQVRSGTPGDRLGSYHSPGSDAAKRPTGESGGPTGESGEADDEWSGADDPGDEP
ncbi:DUF502 domain-containing protein [Halorubrum sp. AD140]|uniref:DUF502 domain-containing protein n=1 Tax=Halorubrum sp. AD140 TaxID=3050073 RepID=UPI002ACCE1C0|nr:DUF502 domain-containing protein [Halorubrum sp. AD140]MDZ5812432.1 DUF502 domain-containing protein [Halorubrum sp. AD140]